MKEILPGIFVIKEVGRFKTIKPPVNIYLIAGKEGVIFDAGYGDKKTIRRVCREIEALENGFAHDGKNFTFSRLLISHCHPDHFSGVTGLRKILNLKVILTTEQGRLLKDKKTYHEAFDGDSYEDYLITHKGVKGKIRSASERLFSHFIYRLVYRMKFVDHVDELIVPQIHLDVDDEDWEIIPSPGHSSDHISLYNKNKGVLLSGDNVLPSITTWLGPPDSDISAYIDTIRRILALPRLELILPAHGEVISTPRERLKDILDHRKERTAQVLKIIMENSDRGTSPNQIIKTLYPNESKVIREFARGWVCLTLKYLEKQNTIVRKQEKNRVCFYATSK